MPGTTGWICRPLQPSLGQGNLIEWVSLGGVTRIAGYGVQELPVVASIASASTVADTDVARRQS